MTAYGIDLLQTTIPAAITTKTGFLDMVEPLSFFLSFFHYTPF